MTGTKATLGHIDREWALKMSCIQFSLGATSYFIYGKFSIKFHFRNYLHSIMFYKLMCTAWQLLVRYSNIHRCRCFQEVMYTSRTCNFLHKSGTHVKNLSCVKRLLPFSRHFHLYFLLSNPFFQFDSFFFPFHCIFVCKKHSEELQWIWSPELGSA